MGRLIRATVCRRFILGVVNEALYAQTTASETLRPHKRHKPNSHSPGVVPSLVSPQRRSGRSGIPIASKEHPNLDVGTSDDDVEQKIVLGSDPLTGEGFPLSTGCWRLIV